MHCTWCFLESTVCCCPTYGSRERPTAEEVYRSSKKRVGVECEACEGQGSDGYQRVCQACDGWGEIPYPEGNA